MPEPIDAYEQVSSEFDAYCDEAIASDARREIPLGAGGFSRGRGGCSLALFLALPRTRVEPPAFILHK